MRRVLAFLILSLLLLMPSALAHPGGTDSIGGHYDNSTGLYHFHHGYSAHHHPGGVCPYDSSRTYPTDKPSRATQTTRPSTSSSSSSLLTRSYTASTRAPTAKPSPTPAAVVDRLSGTDWVSVAFGALVGLPAFFFMFIYPWIDAAKKKKKEKERFDEFWRIERAQPNIGVQAHRLRSVEARSDYTLILEFDYPTDYGRKRIFDAKPLLNQNAFRSLKDSRCFQNYRIIDERILMWSCNAGIAADRLYRESRVIR